MVIARKDEKRWLVSSYNDEGVHQGYATGRDTTMHWTTNAATYVDRAKAERLCAHMERIQRGRIWVVEPAPKVPIDARTGVALPDDVVRKRGMDAAVAEGFALEVERDERFGQAHRTERNKPTPLLDKTPRHALASVLRRQVSDADVAGIEQANDEEGASVMVLVKNKGGKKVAAAKTANKAKSAVKPVPKMKLRTASVASKRTAAASNGGGPCLCACGSKAVKWFRRGHIKILNSKLADIKAGTITPEKALGKQIAAAFGPWTKLKAGGQKPATLDFDKVRAAV